MDGGREDLARESASVHAGWFGIRARTEAVIVPVPTPAPKPLAVEEVELGRHIVRLWGEWWMLVRRQAR